MKNNNNFYTIKQLASQLLGKDKTIMHEKTRYEIDKLIESKEIIATPKNNEVFIDKTSVDHFTSKIVSLSSIANRLNRPIRTLSNHLIQFDVPMYRFDITYDSIYVLKKNVKKYIYNDKYISPLGLIEIIGRPSDGSQNAKKVMNKIRKDKTLVKLLGYKKHDIPLYFNDNNYKTQHAFDYKTVMDFLSNHVSLSNIAKEFNIANDTLKYYTKTNQVTVYSIMRLPHFQYISMNDYEKYRIYRTILDSNKYVYRTLVSRPGYIKIIQENLTYSTIEIKELLKLKSVTNLHGILSEYNINPKHSFKGKSRNYYFYDKCQINNLVEKQKLMYEDYRKRYYTSKQIREVYKGIPLDFLLYNIPEKVIDCPLILRSLFETHVLYEKKEIDSLLKSKIEVNEIRNVRFENPYEEYLHKVYDILEVRFNKDMKNTVKFWHQFVKDKLYMTEKKSNPQKINTLVKSTEVLSSVLSQEIYKYSPVALNRLIFSDDLNEINRTSQRQLYDFLKNLLKNIEYYSVNNLLDITKINDPEQFSPRRIVDKSRYSFEVYKDLFNYANNLDIHKKQAIYDVQNFINGDNYYKYDSYWVYILTHLTNNWRHATVVTEIPQVDLSNTQISSLDWLLQNDISIDDANIIIYQIGNTLKNISKTGAESEFRISDQLKVAFATAISTCQLRADFVNSNKSKPLLNLHDDHIVATHHTLYRMFFREFHDGFKFSNRKMNKTLSSLIWTVFKDIKNVKVSRSHFNEDSTLKYIKLDDQQLEALVSMLFSNDTFGFINDLLVDSLYGKKEDKKLHLDNSRELTITNNYGNVQKIEVSFGLLNKLSKEYSNAVELVNHMSEEEKLDIILKSITNTLYSKQKYYQCIFSKCKFDYKSLDTQDCMTCPYSITNVYALSNLMDLYLEKINHLILNFDSAKKGEKQKLANQFYLLWREIQLAKDKYGDAIYEFVDGGKQRFKELSYSLPQTRNFITINERIE